LRQSSIGSENSSNGHIKIFQHTRPQGGFFHGDTYMLMNTLALPQFLARLLLATGAFVTGMARKIAHQKTLLYLSYAGVDTAPERELAEKIRNHARAKKAWLEVWFDKADLKGGRLWQTEVEEALAKRACSGSMPEAHQKSFGLTFTQDCMFKAASTRPRGAILKFIVTLLAIWATVLAVGSATAAPSCKAHSQFQAVDLSQPFTTITSRGGKGGAQLFKQLGIKTVVRYYAWADGETTCKSLFPDETDAILAGGFNIITIFQHGNSDPETFLDKSRGAKDAREALKLAGANGQPAGSAIYFAVDGVDQAIYDSVFEWSINKGGAVKAARKKRLLRADRSYRKHFGFYDRFRKYHRRAFGKPASAIKGSDILPFVKHYFTEVNRVLKADGKYRVGGYGSGATCNMLLKNKLVDFCWVAMSTGWPGTKQFLASGRWNLAQQETTFCKDWHFNGGERVRFDFNRMKSGNIGQWNKKGPVTPAPGLPEKCKPSW
jgi:Domain of unknown function (DUF1906)